MTEEALSQEIEKILLIIKNPELAVRMAEARIDGKYVLWKQAHVDYANQETGCTKFGATSASGRSTKLRWCISGCGTCRSGWLMICCPKNTMSMS